MEYKLGKYLKESFENTPEYLKQYRKNLIDNLEIFTFIDKSKDLIGVKNIKEIKDSCLMSLKFTPNLNRNDFSYIYESIITLNETEGITYKDILRDIDKRTKTKSTGLIRGTSFVGVEKDGSIIFKTPSSKFSQNGLIYIQRIVPTEFDSVKDMTEFNVEQKTNLLISGGLKVSCTCPAFQYWGYEYIMTQLDACAFKRKSGKIFPIVRNPNLLGSVCKHLFIVLYVLPYNIKKIANEYKKRGFLW